MIEVQLHRPDSRLFDPELIANPVVVSVVVIGRNEGARLKTCLDSVRAANWQGCSYDLHYVDSGSTDNSIEIAKEAGAHCLWLNDTSPCAAKGRNLGWRAALGEFVLFLDGDTLLHPAFVERALDALNDPEVCAAWGHRRESNPGQSVYTRVLDLDWVYPPGRTLYFGGDVLVRREALAQVGGFDPSLKAGEEPELCARLRGKGWQIEHLDVPMTQHDLAVRSFRSYAMRCYRSGIAYAEVASRMREIGDGLWQHEARRDLFAGMLYLAYPFAVVVAMVLYPVAALCLLGLAALVLLRTAWRCRWKAPGNPGLWLQYAVHSHVQKLPALAGQIAWMRARARKSDIGLVEYKDEPQRQPSSARGLKAVATLMLYPIAKLQRLSWERIARLWNVARLKEAVHGTVGTSCVVLGKVELHGTANISIGEGALIYPGVYLETQGSGLIAIGKGVVLSRGVHIVAHDCVRIEDDCMVGEYSSIRDANHRASSTSMRHSGFEAAAIHIEKNVWIGRGVAVLKGARIGTNSIVGANAVVTRSLAADSRAVGIPARAI